VKVRRRKKGRETDVHEICYETVRISKSGGVEEFEREGRR